MKIAIVALAACAVMAAQPAFAQTAASAGRALAILRGRGRPGEVGVTVSSDGLASGKATLFLT